MDDNHKPSKRRVHSREPQDLDPDQVEIVLQRVACGGGQAEIAHDLGLSKDEVRWLCNEHRDEIGVIRRRFFEEAVSALRKGACKAVGVLMDALDSENEGLRVKAAKAIIELTLHTNGRISYGFRNAAAADGFVIQPDSGT